MAQRTLSNPAPPFTPQQRSNLGAFWTPGLRDVARTAPYFHNGGQPTLEGAVRREVIYRNSVDGRPLVIDASEIDTLVAFLKGLDSTEP